jgi:DtxR family Mn-dependent transcriptional regulator
MKQNVENGLTASLEDYIEAIYRICRTSKVARVTDISRMLDVRKSSVTGALKNLSEMDIIKHDPYSFITLTPKGEQLGRDIFHRHTVLKRFFTEILGIPEERAEHTACSIEHAVDRETLEKIITLVEFTDICPRMGTEWLRNHMKNCAISEPDERCITCIKTCSAG